MGDHTSMSQGFKAQMMAKGVRNHLSIHYKHTISLPLSYFPSFESSAAASATRVIPPLHGVTLSWYPDCPHRFGSKRRTPANELMEYNTVFVRCDAIKEIEKYESPAVIGLVAQLMLNDQLVGFR